MVCRKSIGHLLKHKTHSLFHGVCLLIAQKTEEVLYMMSRQPFTLWTTWNSKWKFMSSVVLCIGFVLIGPKSLTGR